MMKSHSKLFLRKGSLVNEKKMQSDLSAAIRAGAKPQSNHFDRAMSTLVSHAVDSFAVPWIIKCLKKYTEGQFHERLSGNYCSIHNTVHNVIDERAGCMPFTFILDFHLNHKKDYGWFLKTLRYLHRWYEINIDTIYQNLTNYLENTWGWRLYDHEKAQIYKELGQIRNMVYYGSYDITQ